MTSRSLALLLAVAPVAFAQGNTLLEMEVHPHLLSNPRCATQAKPAPGT